ncbi:flagellar hook-basal body complex protein [Legionella worsleiensis]|uniref:Flagellar hook protein FlgE n=1 Tax=Legionella worsleiensis TaxID=45076 RepID=A0A0W1A6A3_9GAMM|nr:flagellar hook-basal body complex protein [Legionella worsleiensis]KTD76908.1 flagellar hook protein FlgE [Legionella worsleiensis]STY33422.1 flagellar hook protein FlgE [Legionella worsleiensis]
MRIKTILISVALLFVTPLYASTLFNLTSEPVIFYQCPISITNNPFDLALSNGGYFVVSPNKKKGELLFTRVGQMYLDKNNYFRINDNNYLLAITKKPDTNQLQKLKIPTKNLPAKATSKIHFIINFPALLTDTDEYRHSLTIYDSLSSSHVLTIKSARITANSWQIRVFIDDVERDMGTLSFNTSGLLSTQEGLNHVPWPTPYGMKQLKIDFKTSTQYASPYNVQLAERNGYSSGIVVGASITEDGAISLIYSNGQYRLLKHRIAVALFANPEFLERVNPASFRPTEKSGQAMIHWSNSEKNVVSGLLETDCT